LRELASRSAQDLLVDFLKSREVLLVLDNCEHLVEACAQLAHALLRECSHVSILTTSREALKVAGEVVFRVLPLATPDLQYTPAGAAVTNYEAVQLFVERAIAAVPEFTLSGDNGRAIAQICHRLDGMPLAIELAAARVKVLSVEQIAVRLDDRFRLLTDGSRSALPRHQTLRATIDWSYDLLSAPEQALLRQIAVFAGGWALEAAEIVCIDSESDGLAPHAVLDLLAKLVNKSLVIVEHKSHGGARYYMLETIRQYAWSKLLETGNPEVEQVRERHLDFFLAMIERAEREMKSPLLKHWLDRIDIDYANIRAAAAWAETHRAHAPDDERGLRVVAAQSRYWNLRGHTSDSRRWAEQALAGTSGSTLTRATALRVAGTLATWQDDITLARTLLNESAAILREHGAAGRSGLADTLYALAATMQDDNTSAIALYEESLSLRREIGYTWGIAHSLLNLSYRYADRGDVEEALSMAEEGLRLARTVGDPRLISLLTRACGQFRGKQDDLLTARRLLTESLHLYRDIDDRWGVAVDLVILGDLEARTRLIENTYKAVQLWSAAESIFEADGNSTYRDQSIERTKALAETQLGLAAFDAAWTSGQAMTIEQAVEYALNSNDDELKGE
jgi:predicted ATPase